MLSKIYVAVAFNILEENSVMYAKTEKLSTILERIEVMLLCKHVDFISLRKIEI